jgi:hypothetical protein
MARRTLGRLPPQRGGRQPTTVAEAMTMAEQRYRVAYPKFRGNLWKDLTDRLSGDQLSRAIIQRCKNVCGIDVSRVSSGLPRVAKAKKPRTSKTSSSTKKVLSVIDAVRRRPTTGKKPKASSCGPSGCPLPPVRFNLGNMLTTKAVVELIPKDIIIECLSRFYHGDWGEVSDLQASRNDMRTRDGSRPIFGRYTYGVVTLSIVTDHTTTTLTLLP